MERLPIEPWVAFALTLGLVFTAVWTAFGALYGGGLAARQLLIGSGLDDPWFTLGWAAILGSIAVAQLILAARTLRGSPRSRRAAAAVLVPEAGLVLTLFWKPDLPGVVQLVLLVGVLLVVAGAAALTRPALSDPLAA